MCNWFLAPCLVLKRAHQPSDDSQTFYQNTKTATKAVLIQHSPPVLYFVLFLLKSEFRYKKSIYKKTSKTSSCCSRCVSLQEPQAALHVPNVRAECLLKFQLRPVMEWQRWVCPSVPRNLVDITLQQLGAPPCHRKTIRDGPLHSVAAAFVFFNPVSQVSNTVEPHQGQMFFCFYPSETPFPPATPTSSWKKLQRSWTLWKKWASAGRSAPPSARVRTEQVHVYFRLSSWRSRGYMMCFLLQDTETNTRRWFSWEQDQLCRWRSETSAALWSTSGTNLNTTQRAGQRLNIRNLQIWIFTFRINLWLCSGLAGFIQHCTLKQLHMRQCAVSESH